MNIKITIHLFCFVLFGFLGLKQLIFSNPNDYISQKKANLVQVRFVIRSLECSERVRTSDVLEIVADENGATLFAHIGSKLNCPDAMASIKVGDLVSAFIDQSNNEIYSLNSDGNDLINLDEVLNEKSDNYSNYSAIYFVMAFVFLMALINARSENN